MPTHTRATRTHNPWRPQCPQTAQSGSGPLTLHAADDGRSLGAMNHAWMAMVHDRSSHIALATLRHALAMRSKLFSWRGLNSPNPAPFWILSRSESTQARVSGSRADTIFGGPCESGFERFEWSTVGVVVDECSVDAAGMADPERFQVRLEGMTDEDGCGAALGLELDEGRRGHRERCLCDGPSRWSVVSVHREEEKGKRYFAR